MRIAVYPGSFDPLHIGHLAILKALTEDKRFDDTYLIVSPQNPFKDPSKADNAQQRYEDAIAAIKRHPEIKAQADDIELTMSAPQYTLKTLDALAAREPDNEFVLVIGGDNLAAFRRWDAYDRILLKYGILVYPREGTDCDALMNDLMKENASYKIELIDAPEINISSTEIRSASLSDISDLLM